jgi:spore coat polysaccharide biosynthesis protein SpsF
MSSNRLPGKMLMDLNGRVLLGRVLDRLTLSKRISKIVVATSSDNSDDAIDDFCSKENITCYRGSLEDVAGRLKLAAEMEQAPAFVRINGDSPLIDSNLVDYGIDLFGVERVDLVTNVLDRTFPKGQSVEVILYDSFAAAYRKMQTIPEREHVTKFFYNNSRNYKIVSFTSGGEFNHINMCIDTLQDKHFIENVLKKTNNCPGTWESLSINFKQAR